jgi:hypothetical protein
VEATSVRRVSTCSRSSHSYSETKVKHFFVVVVPCILIILKFFSPTNAHFIEHIKC